MDPQEYRDTGYLILCLFGNLMGDNDFPEAVGRIDSEDLLRHSQRHGMTAIVARALDRNGIKDPLFRERSAMAIRRNILFDNELKIISEKLEEAGIEYLPLKGAVLKRLYPSEYLREMSDLDILVDDDSADRIKELMTSLGYRVESFRKSNHDVYVKGAMFTVEIHRSLFDPFTFPQLHQTAERIRGRLRRAEGYRCRLQASHEDFYLMMVLHAYKHYITGGMGIRILADVSVFLRSFADSLRYDMIAAETKACGAERFEQDLRELSQHFMQPGSLTEAQRDLLDAFLLSGLYGSKKRARHYFYAASVGKDGKKGKIRYLKKRLSVPEGRIRRSKFFSRHRRLVPLLAIYRPIKAIVTRPHKLYREWKELKKL